MYISPHLKETLAQNGTLLQVNECSSRLEVMTALN